MLFKGKKILILAGAGTHVKVVKAAKELGLYTIVTDYLKNSPAKQIADESWMFSITDVDEIVAKCKEVGVDGVLNFCIDPAQWPYYEICRRLDLPCTVTRDQLEIMTNKNRFKEYCQQHDVDIIPEYSLNEIENDYVEYPLFVKPSVNRGSRGQAICYSKADALNAFHQAEKESGDGKAICEKYMGDHQDIGSAFFVVDREPHLIKLGDRFLGKKEDHLAGQVMCTRLPSSHYDHLGDCFDRVKKMIRSLGIKFGPVFMQGFVDGDTIRYYDPALRMPGGDYDLILKQATGFDTVKSMIHFAMTGEAATVFGNPEKSCLLSGGTALLFTFSVRPGLIAEVVGLETLMQHKYVVYGRQMISKGTVVPDSGDIRQRVAAIGAYLPCGFDLGEFVNEVYHTFHVYDEKGEDMIVSRVARELF